MGWQVPASSAISTRSGLAYTSHINVRFGGPAERRPQSDDTEQWGARSRVQGPTPRRSRSDRPLPPASRRRRARRPTAPPISPVTGRLAAWAAVVLERFGDRGDSARLAGALVLALFGLLVLATAAVTDRHLHRGIERGDELPYVIHRTGRELATNADLTSIPPERIEQTAEVLQGAGFRYVRQSFAWSAIEPERGQFAWDRYDALVDALNRRGIQVLAVLHRSPDWARPAETRGLPDAPPAEPATYTDFVERVARRYADRVTFYQIWDQPNLAERWGGQPATPSAYAALLGQGANAVRQANPAASVVLAEFAPAPTGGGLTDLALLDGIYRAGAGVFFDIAAVKLDGGTQSPNDRRVGAERENFARAILFRERMTDWGDSATPLWATRYGWATGEGGVSPDEQAAFAVAGLRRSRDEWPWMGLMFAWDLLPVSPDAPERPYALLPNGQSGPLFNALAEFATTGVGVAGGGLLPPDAPPVTYEGNWADQDLTAGFRTTTSVGAVATVRFRGSGLIATLRYGPQAGIIHATLDGEPLAGWPEVDGAGEIDLESSLQARDIPIRLISGLDDDQTHELQLTLATDGEITLGSLVVVRDVPFLWPVATLAVAGVVILFVALREAAYTIARRTGHIRRERGVELWPVLPRLPDWRPSRRV